MRRLLPVLLGLLLLSAACTKEDGLRYSGLEMGQLCKGIFTTDRQIALSVTGNPSGYDLQSDRRIMARYQAFSDKGETTISLLELWETVTVLPAPAGDAPGLVTDDPVSMEDAWFSGGYLNLGLRFKGNDPDLHHFSLAFSNEQGKMLLRLFHDNRENVRTDDNRHAYLCLPLETVTEAFRKETPDAKLVPIVLSWMGYNAEGTADLLRQEGNYRP